MDAQRSEEVARVVRAEVDVQPIWQVLSEILGRLRKHVLELRELRHCAELFEEAAEYCCELSLPLRVVEQAFVEPVHELGEHRVLARVAQLVVEPAVGIEDRGRERRPHDRVRPGLSAVGVAACEAVLDGVAVLSGVLRVVYPTEVGNLAAGAVWARDSRYRRADLDGDAVAVSPVEVVVFEPTRSRPLVTEEEVEGTCEVALAGVVLT